MKLSAADFAALDDAQRVAVLESLVAGVMADGKVNAVEAKRFEEVVIALPWGIQPPVLMAMVQGAQQRIAALSSAVEVNDFIASLAASLPSSELRDKVLFTMASMIYADGDVNQLERNVLGMFVVAFNITSDRVAAIKAAVTGRPVPPPTAPTDVA